MTTLWHQFGTLALVIAAVFWAWVMWQLVGWAKRSPRQFARTLCGELALLFGVLALLWAAHLSDKWL